MLTTEQQKRLDEGIYYMRLVQEGRLYSDVIEMLRDFQESALGELRAFQGGDKDTAFHLLRQYQARCDFAAFFELCVKEKADQVASLCEELGLDYTQVRLMSEVSK